jgi:hypothetical protein
VLIDYDVFVFTVHADYEIYELIIFTKPKGPNIFLSRDFDGGRFPESPDRRHYQEDNTDYGVLDGPIGLFRRRGALVS